MSDRSHFTRRRFLGTLGASLLTPAILSSTLTSCKPIVLGADSNSDSELPPSPDPKEAVMGHPTIIDAVHLRVRSLERTLSFYTSVLGLTLLSEEEATASLGLPESPDRPLLYLHQSPDAPPRSPLAAGLFHIAFRVPHESSLADSLRRIQGAGDRLDGASNHGISHALYLRDPEGNGLEVYFDRPQDEWPLLPNGHLRLATRRLDLQRLLESPPSPESQRLPAGTDIGHIHLEGLRIEDAKRFYVDLLGLDITVDLPSVLFTSRSGYHHHVGLNIWNRRQEPRDPDSLGLLAIEATLPAAHTPELIETAQLLGFPLDPNSPTGRLILTDSDQIQWRLLRS